MDDALIYIGAQFHMYMIMMMVMMMLCTKDDGYLIHVPCVCMYVLLLQGLIRRFKHVVDERIDHPEKYDKSKYFQVCCVWREYRGL